MVNQKGEALFYEPWWCVVLFIRIEELRRIAFCFHFYRMTMVFLVIVESRTIFF
jgi:hypothetical protein